MGPKPFVPLAAPRAVNRPDFPPDLARFYAENEAVEFEGTDYGSPYLYPLRDVKRWSGRRREGRGRDERPPSAPRIVVRGAIRSLLSGGRAMKRGVTFGAWVLVAVCGCGKSPTTAPAVPEAIYPAGSKIADEHAPGGFGVSSNFPKDLDKENWGAPGAVSLVAFPGEFSAFGKRQGFAVRLVNRTGAAVGFAACDSCLYMTQEALDRDGKWRAIEVPHEPKSAKSAHRVFLDKNQYWEFPARHYTGSFKTRLRLRLDQGTERPVEGTDPPVMQARRGGRVIDSNAFDGSIDESQFAVTTDE
jgi:hypothetical protein